MEQGWTWFALWPKPIKTIIPCVIIWQNETKDIIDVELQLLNDTTQLHILKQYNISCQRYLKYKNGLQGVGHHLQ